MTGVGGQTTAIAWPKLELGLEPQQREVQQTLAAAVERSGIGLHSGESVLLRLLPAEVGAGRYFVRIDLPDAPQIPARLEAVHQTRLSTELRVDSAAVRTVEHLLAALAALGIDNARIEINGPEVPLLDGSAQGWVEAIREAGTEVQAQLRPVSILTQPICIQAGDAFVTALPAADLRFTYGIDFELAAIGNQWQSWSPDVLSLAATGKSSFAAAIAPARTFGLAHQIEALRQQGLIRGGSLENALVCDQSGWLNPPLRFPNEPVRHKLLDLVGDLSLLGTFPKAHFLAYKASHELHVQLAQQIEHSAL